MRGSTGILGPKGARGQDGPAGPIGERVLIFYILIKNKVVYLFKFLCFRDLQENKDLLGSQDREVHQEFQEKMDFLATLVNVESL